MILIGAVIAILVTSCHGDLMTYLTDTDIAEDMTGWLPLEVTDYTTALHKMHGSKKFRYHPVVNPIYVSETFQQRAPGEDYGFVYSRINNPTRESLERVIANLDSAKYATTFPSGMGAIYATLKMLGPKDHIVCSMDVYDGTYRYVSQNAGKEFEATFVLPTIADFVGAIKNNTRMLWVESPSNPILKVTDIIGLVKAVRAIKRDIVIVLDNSFLGPFFQKGLVLGVDVVVVSLSKYMNGHGDVIMGAAVTNHESIHDYLLDRQQHSGMIPAPFDCYQVVRGLKTYPVRMVQHWKNAIRIAKWLETNPYVGVVHYPGLKSQSKLPKKLWSGMSGMLSFELKNFSLNMTGGFLAKLRYFKVAWSLGAVESLAEQPYVMLATSFPEDLKVKLGITPNLVRLSVGLEYYNDLINDLDQAMKATAPAPTERNRSPSSSRRMHKPSGSKQLHEEVVIVRAFSDEEVSHDTRGIARNKTPRRARNETWIPPRRARNRDLVDADDDDDYADSDMSDE